MRRADDPVVGAVVDAYSTGNYLRASFAKLGVRLVHVQSTAEIMGSLPALDFSNYLENVIHVDEASTVARLRAHDPLFVAVGQEPGVPLADRLSEAMGLASNGSKLSLARRDKFEMIETIRSAGLHCARQFKSDDPAAIRDWADRHGVSPAVVKPPSSGASDNVYICTDPAQITVAAERILAARDVFGVPNREVLIQSYLPGVEYIVDTVSCDGQRYVCGVWQYHKSVIDGGRNIYDRDVLLAPDAHPAPELIAYVDRVLAALNIRWGAGHAEVKLTPEGPALVEIGARLNGNMHPEFHDACLGHNQADLTALAYTRPAEFQERFGDRVYPRLRHAMVYNAPTTLDGVVTGVDQAVVDEISAVPGVEAVTVKIKPGGRIKPTVDLLSSPLRVFLTAGTDEQLTAAHEAVRRLKDGVYQV